MRTKVQRKRDKLKYGEYKEERKRREIPKAWQSKRRKIGSIVTFSIVDRLMNKRY